MAEADCGNRNFPTASQTSEPLSYSQQITSDMPWVLRFVGSFMMLQGIAPVIENLPRISGLVSRGFTNEERIDLRMMPIPLAIGLGIYRCWRWALIAAIVLCLCQDLRYLWFMSLRHTVTAWLWQFPVAATEALLAWAIYRRADRSGVLTPTHPDRGLAPPSGDEILWLCRCVGICLLLPAMKVAMLYAGVLVDSSLRNPLPLSVTVVLQIVPTTCVAQGSLAAIFAALGIALLFGRYRALVPCTVVAAVSYLVLHIAYLRDYDRPGSPLLMWHRPDWQDLLPHLLTDLLTAGFCLVLYRKSRGRA